MKITKEQLAARLNNCEYGAEITNKEEQWARENNLVVVFGYSDDNVELRGAINDEIGCGNGSEFRINKLGVMMEPDYDEKYVLEKFNVYELVTMGGQKITTVWNAEGYSWIYKTDIPHVTFDILDDDIGSEKYCRGIIFNLEDL